MHCCLSDPSEDGPPRGLGLDLQPDPPAATGGGRGGAQFFIDLRKAGVNAELHLYQKGRHGFGLAEGHPVLSVVVNCETQQEVDELSAGGQIVECGWLTDKYGVSWQIVPTALVRLLQDKDPARSRRAMKDAADEEARHSWKNYR